MKNRLRVIMFAVSAFAVFSSPLSAHFDSDVDMVQLATAADFIFKGQVINVDYRNSEAVPLTDPDGNQAFDEDGNIVYVDGSNLPHTFVTYQVEQVYKGPRSSPSQLTLRFAGGHTGEVDPLERRYLFIEPYPLFDIGDRDVLFVQGNTAKPCPLTRGQTGRFRILPDPDASGAPFIFSETGMEIRVIIPPDVGPVMDWPVVLGPQHLLPEILTYTIGDEVFEEVFVNPTEGILPPPGDNPQGIRFSEADFDDYLTDLVGELFTPEDLLNLPAVQNADINQIFYGEQFAEAVTSPLYPPNPCTPSSVCETPRPWLDEVLTDEERQAIFEAERQEVEWFTRSGGNPVLPQSPCDQEILLYGALPGDLSGPDGRPDCHVDLIDMSVFAAHWLLCNDPDSECL